ncbi:hypothetical protein NEMIN01_0804 [Nematocida minor]|uniref:uncharacterized protein n=1 Tax=Nematocida minor TaxID=1912983 RepID=UPI00221E78E7|nr:uncharacterized protein NEMIN01_0804 [Nematocida minor]KAI5190019.1 hypothetical protein NEMIN01_0804 [Nematocida minor]
MWIEVYTEESYKIEKRIENAPEEKDSTSANESENEGCGEYYSPREYVINAMVGRYRLLDKITGDVLCGSWSFNKLLQWIEEGLPDLFESVAFGLNIGSYIKSYEGEHSVVILGSNGMGVFSSEDHRIIQYANIRKIEVGKLMTIHMLPEVVENGAGMNSPQCNEYEKESFEIFQDLEKEIITLSVSPIEEGGSVRNLLFRRISERICATIPLYNQKINHVAVHETGTISLTDNFIIIKEDLRYLAMPLCMIRKVEVVREWKTVLKIRDANYRNFELILEDSGTGIDKVLANISKESPAFKSAYFSVLLDIVENMHFYSQHTQSASNWSMGSTSEYRMYLCMKLKDNLNLAIPKEERPFMWMGCFCLCGMVAQPDLYELSIEKSKKVFYQSYSQIDKDIERSIYGEIPEKTLAGFKRVMYAFAAANNDEYLQSHSMVAGVLFRVLGESGCFYGLIHIFTRTLPGYTGPDIYGMHRDIWVFIEFAKEKYPGLHENLTEKSIEMEILVTPWILGLFTTLFLQPQIESIFDYIAYYGASFVFKLSLALLERMYLGLSRSKATGSILKTSKNYFFKNTSMPSIDSKEFGTLMSLAKSDKLVTSEIVLYKRQQYELLHRKNKEDLLK